MTINSLHKQQKYIIALLLCIVWAPFGVTAQELRATDSIMEVVSTAFERYKPKGLSAGKVLVKQVQLSGRHLYLHLNDAATDYPYRQLFLDSVTAYIRKAFVQEGYPVDVVSLYTKEHPAERLIPQAFGGKYARSSWANVYPKNTPPLVRHTNAVTTPVHGLLGRHLALWQSHGLYFSQKQNKWIWQRSKLNQTVEDLFTASYIIPYIVPMLERSGAIVLLPRERDLSAHEYLVDNTPQKNDHGKFSLTGKGKQAWEKVSVGFGYTAKLSKHENPFRQGTSLRCKTTRGKATTSAVWTPNIKETGEYAVYVSYQSAPNSATDAHYIIEHAGGSETFEVNQQMGGGTWIYLGTYTFLANATKEQGVRLTNESAKAGSIVSADAVKIGGGIGNVMRQAPPKQVRRKRKKVTLPAPAPHSSGYPRYAEAARYWLQWAGVPDSVYSPTKGKDDYKDDYRSRPLWVNYLCGGTAAVPNSAGLKIPIDLSLALHSDAGTRPGNDIVGTLAIYCTNWEGRTKYPSGAPKVLSRELSDIVQSYLVRDLRVLAPEWKRRALWDKPYSEATLGYVPALLLEFLSHQNLADMRYGLDPTVRFTVSRAIYKGILRYLSHEYQTPYVVQPLPVKDMEAHLAENNKRLRLQWKAQTDSLEPTASPNGFILYTAVGTPDAPFDRGVPVFDQQVYVDLKPGVVYRFKVEAFNAGGRSFPSEVIAAGVPNTPQGRVMVINGFDKVSAPETYSSADGSVLGFRQDGMGVPYLQDQAYCFATHAPTRGETDSDHSALPTPTQETAIIRGNTFDFTGQHGAAFMELGYAFTSASHSAVAQNPDNLKTYDITNVILGKQRTYQLGPNKENTRFNVLSPDLQFALETFLLKGKSAIISGAYVASDLCLDTLTTQGKLNKAFAHDVLKIALAQPSVPTTGVAIPENPKLPPRLFNTRPNPPIYHLNNPDAIVPSTSNGTSTPLYFKGGAWPAAVIYKGPQYHVATLTLPLEIIPLKNRVQLLQSILTSPQKNSYDNN